jgi:hypothetical protein
MGGTDEGCRDAIPVRVIPERGQVTKHVLDGWTTIAEEPAVTVLDDDGSKES